MKALVFGEVLFDVFGDEAVLGGAPMNFAAHLVKLGEEAALFSAVGDDELGQRVLESADACGVESRFIASVPFETGRCLVTVKDGEPSYNLLENVAYDHLRLTDAQRPILERETFDVFYFGTLAGRFPESRETLHALLETMTFVTVFFDVNFRRHYYDAESVAYGLDHADIVKLNRNELAELRSFSVIPDEQDERSFVRRLAERFSLRAVIVTLDKDGAYVYEKENDRFFDSPKPQSMVVSTVGAGDSFSACFLHEYLEGRPMDVCLRDAVILSDYVVRYKGAIPDYDEELRASLGI